MIKKIIKKHIFVSMYYTIGDRIAKHDVKGWFNISDWEYGCSKGCGGMGKYKDTNEHLGPKYSIPSTMEEIQLYKKYME